ncbi:hypothetical protein KP509_11G079000 [Ceratopteris richardii]|uniref:Uncharacterized protein n=1 Tax=Ceratopteris richardii TaxID=49495 RepID=A0A8T2TU69_CERRI|nr:hypothetical protein KP509_11G079000 [Ceratopteris richardii]
MKKKRIVSLLSHKHGGTLHFVTVVAPCGTLSKALWSFFPPQTRVEHRAEAKYVTRLCEKKNKDGLYTEKYVFHINSNKISAHMNLKINKLYGLDIQLLVRGWNSFDLGVRGILGHFTLPMFHEVTWKHGFFTAKIWFRSGGEIS